MHYIGDDRIYSIEEARDSAYQNACDALKRGAKILPIDKKHKAKGVFMDQLAGPGLIVPGSKSLIVIRPEYSDSYHGKKAKVVTAASKLRVPSPKGKLKLDGRLLLMHSAFSASDVAKNNWPKRSFLDGATARACCGSGRAAESR